MRNLFVGDTYQAGIGFGGRVLGAVRIVGMGQTEKVESPREAPRIQKLDTNGSEQRQAQASARPERLSPRRDRFQWAVDRLCTMMRRLSKTKANPQSISRVFWAFVKHAKSSEESVITAYKTLCPDMAVPEKPIKRAQDKPPVPVPITYPEAVQISGELNKAMETVTPDVVVELASGEGSGTLAPEDLPRVEVIQEELVAFVAAGDPASTLTVDQEDVAAAERAIAQASEVKKQDTTKLLLGAATVVGLGALLYYTL